MDPNANPPVQEQAPLEVMPPAQQQIVQKPGSGKKRIIIISVAIFFFLILCTTAGIFFIQNSRKDPAPVVITPTQVPNPTQSTPISYKNIRLPLDQPTQVSNSDIELTYQGKEEAECPDCYSSTKIKLVAGGEEAIIDYYCGGIAGDCSVMERVLGYEVELIENFDPNQIVVSIREI